MQSNDNKNRGTHGDSLCMLNELSLSNKNPLALAVGSVNDTLRQRGLIMVCEFNDYIKAKGGARSVLQ